MIEEDITTIYLVSDFVNHVVPEQCIKCNTQFIALGKALNNFCPPAVQYFYDLQLTTFTNC